MQKSEIPPQVFFSHLEKLRQTWITKFGSDFDSIILVNGKASAANEKTVAILSWLFAGYNLADTIINFTKKSTIIFTSERKIQFLNEIKQNENASRLNLKFRSKEDNNSRIFEQIWKQLHGNNANPQIGMMIKDAKTGQVAQEYQKFLTNKSYTSVDASHFFNECFARKDHQQIENIKKSAHVSTYFLSVFIKKIESVIDVGDQAKHSDITKNIEDLFNNQGDLKKCSLKIGVTNPGIFINKQYIQLGVINVQSGGSYSEQLFAVSNKKNLKYDCIVLGLGTLYKSFNSYVSRTLLINPTEQQKSTYKRVVALCKIIQQNLKPGVPLNLVYDKAVQFMKQHLPNITPPKSFGFGIGIFLVEHLLQIDQNNQRVIQVGNTFVINCHFPNIKPSTNDKTKQYCIQISDTVVVTEKSQQILTSNASTLISDISYELGEQQPKKPSKRPSKQQLNQGRRTRNGPKAQQTKQKLSNQKKRMQHQMQLKHIKLDELKQRVHENFSGQFKKQKNIECHKLQSYKSHSQFPKQMKKNQIYVDSKNNSILLPINGKHVPFHIHVLKSVVKNQEGKYASLRFNFHLPGTVANLIFPKYGQNCSFLKEMVFRSQQKARISDLQKQIKNLQKKVKLDLSEKNAKQDIVDQEPLKLNKGKKPILRDLMTRPGIGQKKVKGILQCHLNGFKYSTSKGDQIDVAFSNVKYAFFQPCEKQIIVAVHFRLYEPIMVGKKKSQDVQFYTQGGPNAQDVDKRGRGNFGDEDDDEQKQKQARRRLDKEFRDWMSGCQEYIGKHFKFQTPNREAGFYGNPFNNNSLLQPTKSCLINITENKFFICPLANVEIVCFERMYSNVRSFDMIFVMKDYQNFMKINSIPINDVQKVKDWLDSKDIIFYDQGKNLNWIKFLGVIRKDFKKFVDDKAWMAWDEADNQQQILEEDQDDSYTEQEDSDEDSGSDSESSSGYEEEGSSSEGGSEEDLSEEGLSSDELDERAEKEDRERDRREMERQRDKEKMNNGANGGAMKGQIRRK